MATALGASADREEARRDRRASKTPRIVAHGAIGPRSRSPRRSRCERSIRRCSEIALRGGTDDAAIASTPNGSASCRRRRPIASTTTSGAARSGVAATMRSAGGAGVAVQADAARSTQAPAQPAHVEIAFERGVPIGDQRRDDAARRADREPVDDRRRARRRPPRSRQGHAPTARARARSTKPRPPSCCISRTRELERFVSSESQQRFARSVAAAYADVIDRGEWFDRCARASTPTSTRRRSR